MFRSVLLSWFTMACTQCALNVGFVMNRELVSQSTALTRRVYIICVATWFPDFQVVRGRARRRQGLWPTSLAGLWVIDKEPWKETLKVRTGVCEGC